MSLQEEIAADPVAGAVLSGMDMRHILSTGLAAMPSDANGVPFNMSHIYASGNIAGDMYCNVAAEATGRNLAVPLYNSTDDPGMKDMLEFNIARDTMHQEQWLAVLEELGPSHLPIPNSFPQAKEKSELAYNFIVTTTQGIGTQENQPWTSGTTPEQKSKFTVTLASPLGEVPDLGFGRPDTFSQKEQAMGTAASIVEKGKDVVERLTKGTNS